MQHFPIYLDLQDEHVIVSGAGETAVAKLRLLLKTLATITVFGSAPAQQVLDWAQAGRLLLIDRPIHVEDDIADARLLYAANNDSTEDARAAHVGRTAGVLVNIVDNIKDSHFITPAIIDRDPVTVAIGTEGAAPVLARRLKDDFESQLDGKVGTLARIGKQFRPRAEALPDGRERRAFWAKYYDEVGPSALAESGDEAAVESAIAGLLDANLSRTETATNKPGKVWLVGAGPGDPDLLTNKARRVLHEADIVIHDRLVSNDVLELARREALFIEVGKTPGGKSWTQDDINALMVAHAGKGAHVARLKSGDPTI